MLAARRRDDGRTLDRDALPSVKHQWPSITSAHACTAARDDQSTAHRLPTSPTSSAPSFPRQARTLWHVVWVPQCIHCLAALHNPPQNAAVPDAPFDRTGPLAQELLELTARITARAEEDPFGNPVLLVALAISRRIEAGALDDACDRRADRASARRALSPTGHGASPTMSAAPMSRRTPRRWRNWRSACCGRTRTTARCGGPSTAPWWSGRALPRCSPRIRHSPCPSAVAQALAETASGRATAAAGSHRPPPITLADEFAQAAAAIAHGRDAHRPVQCRTSVGRAQCLAGSLDRTRPAPGDPVELGGLRHRRSHRHRLVGHAAAAAGDEAPAACAVACTGRRAAGNGSAVRAHRRWHWMRSANSSISARTRPTRRGSPRSRRRWWGGAKPR